MLAVALVLFGAVGSAVATADDLPSSGPDLYRSTTGSDNMAQNGFDGSGTTVAIIDTGVADVPGLHGKVIHQENISAAPAEGDQYGHGTFVAGLVHEVAPGAEIVSIKLSGPNGAVDVTQVMAALQWVSLNRERFSIDVVNLSFGNDSKQSAYYSPLNYAVQQLWDEGIVVVASAGNLGGDAGTVTKPGDDPLIISVGATDEQGTNTRDDDFVPTFVSRGPTQDGLSKPDLVAPGTRVVSLRAPGSTADVNNPQARIGDEHFRGSGTSFAAPIVAGVVAQMLGADPDLVPDQVKFGLLRGASAVAGDEGSTGAGQVRAMRALNLARSGRANAYARRSAGTGSLDGARGSAVVDVTTPVILPDGNRSNTKVRVRGQRMAKVATEPALAPDLGEGETPEQALDTFDPGEYLDQGEWDASHWGASHWGASQWGASHWGASHWGASHWGASHWGSSQWWASHWG